jgi:hypothetical protein
MMYLLTLILLGVMVLFGFISVFVPWVMKDLAVGTRAWAYPFKTCIEDTFSIVNAESCLDNDFIKPTGVPLTGGSAQCKAFILTTIAFVFISVILGVVLLVALTGIIFTLWSRPVMAATVVQTGLVLVCLAAFLSWIMFICYAEKTCAPDSIFPVKGYSYGFILYIFGSTASLGAVVTGFLGLSKLKSFQPLSEEALDDEQLLPREEQLPQEYPMYVADPMAEVDHRAPVPSSTPISHAVSQASFNYPTQNV